MKRAVVLLMAMAMVFQLIGCGDEKADRSGAASTGEMMEERVTISNPFVEATDKDIYEQLGISMRSEAVASLQSEYIVGGRFAQLDFLMSDIDGNDVKACLRAEKNKEETESLHGLYFDDMSEPEVLESVSEGINMYFTTCDGGNWKIYEWSIGDVSYALTYSGDVSQMQVGATLDQVMAAVQVIDTEE